MAPSMGGGVNISRAVRLIIELNFAQTLLT